MLYVNTATLETATSHDNRRMEEKDETGKFVWETRNDWKTMDEALEIATRLNEAEGCRVFEATDAGPSCSPRYDVIVLPELGDEVSRSFNGNTYSAGTIFKISGSLRRIETSDGTVFWRRKLSGAWLAGGIWSMVKGNTETRNPHV